MEITIIILLLLIAAQTSYLSIQSARKVSHRKFYKPIFVDTSVLIDGRITAVAQSGFITSTLYVPRSVIGELQFMADQADHEKRSRARHGLDVVSELQALPDISVKIFADKPHVPEGVDNRLLALAKRYGGSVCTIDYNLNKVAQVENIPVLNVNNLAMNLRMAYLPGERTTIELAQKGNDAHQAVGHLMDGTMVVVEQAHSLIGQRVEVEFIRGLQTAAGRMMFARIVGKQKLSAGEKPQKQKPIAQVKNRPVAHKNVNAPNKRPVKQANGRKKSSEDQLVSLINNQD